MADKVVEDKMADKVVKDKMADNVVCKVDEEVLNAIKNKRKFVLDKTLTELNLSCMLFFFLK